MALTDQSHPECTQTQLHKHAVVQYLCFSISQMNRLLQVAHQEPITCDIIVCMQCVMIDMAKNSARALALACVVDPLIKIHAKGMHEMHGPILAGADFLK